MSTTPTTTSIQGFAASYAQQASRADEMLEPDGSLRPVWHKLVDHFDEIGSAELQERWEQARKIIRDDGITYNVYDDGEGEDRPWNLDLVPLMIPSAEWNGVSEGLEQRARLLDALLADLYGAGRMIAEGVIPPELLHTNPAFLRPLHGAKLPGNRWLHFYSADLIRSIDGRFIVLNDRTQSPSGAGYALENRLVMLNVLSTAFRQSYVRRVAPFFISVRQMLRNLAARDCENPRIVLLTPGPYNEMFFEHAYLSRYLGYTLVKGSDLTVRDGVVYLKTLSGLQRIDVILRRVDADYCDPLELYQQSYLGVPGLVEAVRQGNVTIANALGSALVQSPAFLAYLPTLCQKLLDEELLLPSVQTWYCGEKDSLRYVLDHMSTLVIKPALETRNVDPTFGSQLSSAQLEELREQIIAHPSRYVAQEHVVSRTAPVLKAVETLARPFVLRTYAVAEKNSYSVMTGGLTRLPISPDSLIVSMQQGSGSKDTWVCGDHPINEPTLLSPTSQPLELTRGGGETTSRVADDMFWLGRYLQRFESEVRIARCLFARLMDAARPEAAATATILRAALLGRGSQRVEELSVHHLVPEVFGQPASRGLRASIGNVRTLVRGLRDRISPDAWRILVGIERSLSSFDTKVSDDQVGEVLEFFNQLCIELLGFGGVVADSMTRGQAWRFMEMGLRLERAIAMCRLITSTITDALPTDSALLETVLEVGDSALTYRRRYLTQLQIPAIVDLLVCDQTNPRAVIFQIAALEDDLAKLPPAAGEFKSLVDIQTRIASVDMRIICEANRFGFRPGLDQLMNDIIDSLAALSQWLSQAYFTHALGTQSFNGRGEDLSVLQS